MGLLCRKGMFAQICSDFKKLELKVKVFQIAGTHFIKYQLIFYKIGASKLRNFNFSLKFLAVPRQLYR